MKLNSWLQTWWLRVPTPREFSIAYTIVYLVSFLTGIVTLIAPPITIKTEIGPAAMASIGYLLIVGALISMVGGARKFWKLERVGLWFMSCAWGIYGILVLILHVTTPGSRLTQLGAVTLALILYFIRYLMIRKYTYQPGG
jgi:hypothetical protein